MPSLVVLVLTACSPEAAVAPDGGENISAQMTESDASLPGEEVVAALTGSASARYLRQEEFSTPFGKVVVGEFGYPDGEFGHATPGRLDVAYLRSGDQRREFKGAVEVGSNGRVGEWDVVYNFTGTPVIYASGGFTGQGMTEGCTVLTELTDAGPRTIAVIPDYSGGASFDGEETDTKGKIGQIVKRKSFTVTYSGDATGRLHYEWNGSAFATSDEPILSHCGFA